MNDDDKELLDIYLLEMGIRLTERNLIIERFESFASQPTTKQSKGERELKLSDLAELLSHVHSLIAGWNATEEEWSEWDKSVLDEVLEMQLKIDGKTSLIFKK